MELLDEMEALWSPPDNPVFELTSKSVYTRIKQLYDSIGSPLLTYNSIWDIFERLQECLAQDLQDDDREVVATEFKSLEENFHQDAYLVDVTADEDEFAPPDEDAEDDPFFDDRLFSDDDEPGNLEDDGVEYEVVLTEDEEEDDEIHQYLTQH